MARSRWSGQWGPVGSRCLSLRMRLVVLEVVEQQVEGDEADLARELLEKARVLPARLDALLHRLLALRTRQREEHLSRLFVESRLHLGRMLALEMRMHGAAMAFEGAICASHLRTSPSWVSSSKRSSRLA